MSDGTSARCATCGKPATKANNKAFPFCGARCQMIDLGKWLDEEYRVPADHGAGDESGGGTEGAPAAGE